MISKERERYGLKLTIPKTIVDELRRLANEEAPLEVCGLFGGKDDKVLKFYPMTNADASPVHFSMIPSEQFAVSRDMREAGLSLLAIWHSHPATPPRVSAEDMRLAYTRGVAYAILSLAVPEDQALRGYEIHDGTPQEIEITVTDNQDTDS